MYPNGWGYMFSLRRSWVRITLILMIPSPLTQFLFDSGSSHNFVNDRLVQIWGIQPTISDHAYRVHLPADGRVQYINGVVYLLGISIDTYVEEVDFHVMNLCTTNVVVHGTNM